MATVMTSAEFVKRLKAAATDYKTLYVMGCFGAPMNSANKKRYTSNHSYNKQAARTAMINAATADTFGFDCVCLIKGILWGWSGDKNKTYGGAGYAVNGVPDIGADSMIKVCSGVSTNFSGIVPGEAVWMEGHIGVYIGDGLAVECTPKWDNKVQITAVGNIGKKSGYNTRTWTKHGKLPYVDYSVQPVKPVEPSKPTEPNTPAPTEIKEGSKVEIKASAEKYNPASCAIPGWVKSDYYHIVTQTTSNGKPVVKGGKTCVLLGKKVKKSGGSEVAGINTWVAVDNLTVVGMKAKTETCRVHTVVKGDTLWGISQKYLGSGTRYPEIMKLNGLTSTLIFSGQKLNIPN